MVVVVEIIDESPKEKIFLGGWRDNLTGILYYNAFTQTSVNGRDFNNKCNSFVQTVNVVNVSTCTYRDKAVRTSYVPDVKDKFVRVRNTFNTTTELLGSTNLLLETSAIKIQRFYRAYRARKNKGGFLENFIEERSGFLESSSRPLERIDLSRLDVLHPETKSDFDRLYNALEEWRILEIERVTGKLFHPSKIAVCSLILSREVELLRKIDAMKSAVKLKLKERRRCYFLEELSKPVLWRINQGESILVDTPIVLRSRQFQNLYQMLSTKDDNTDDDDYDDDNDNKSSSLSFSSSIIRRMKLLMKIKKEAEPHTCIYSDELIYLINQEIDLLSRNTKVSKLHCLRERIKLAFLLFAKSYLINYQKNCDRDEDRIASRICKNCGRILPKTKYLSKDLGRFRQFSSCVYCISLRPGRTPRIVYEPYRRMLREVRRLETRNRCNTGFAFVIPPKVVYRLVNTIWHGKSPISECDILDRLCLLRFRNDVEWSPWNTLLLTKEEALKHQRLKNIEEYYDEDLLRQFHLKNLQAKLCFIFKILK
ncbi:PREDICTED: IQ and ubiquitin-like domain-containing protein [Polistes dominula]|uniref:IQ and ubiquitin-like domain-containing protein n=1 Tax=Polistes dominula TaxID=743375 RepID=A0ABM1HU15_POLDO|nr:PREDICTED: IQ and ubiquitin-like domain-containing protein [Polistes dominula]